MAKKNKKGKRDQFACLDPRQMAGMGEPAAVKFEKALKDTKVDESIFTKNTMASGV
jgi:hypothetical protein